MYSMLNLSDDLAVILKFKRIFVLNRSGVNLSNIKDSIIKLASR